MRTLLLIPALLLLAAAPQAHRPVSAAATRDWTATASRTADGAILIGNPAAKVRLAEYLSYVCPHCAAFTAESHAILKEQWVRDGSVAIELRPVPTQPMDLAAAILARCVGPRASAFTDAVYAQQQTWFERGAAWQATNGERVNLYPALARLRAVADGAGLTEIAQSVGGLTPVTVDRCFATDAELRAAAAVAAAADITATPSFAINGKSLGPGTWASLEPQLRAAGAH